MHRVVGLTHKHRDLSTETYEIVAEDGKRFFAHSNILASESKLLKIPTDSSKESTARRIDLTAWDGDTVGRLVEFLYVRHYRVPDPTPIIQEQASVTDILDADSEITVSEDDFHHRGASTPDTVSYDGDESPMTPRRPLTPLFSFQRRINTGGRSFLEKESETLAGIDSSKHDYKEVLLAHAKVYALARYGDVEALREQALQRLLSTLMTLHPVNRGSRVAANVIDLLRYVYSHPCPLPSSEEQEPIRRVVSQFAALDFPALQSREELKVLIREGGELASDLMDKVCRRLVNSEAELATDRQKSINRESVLEELEGQLQQASALEPKVQSLEVNLASEKQLSAALTTKVQLVENNLANEKQQTSILTAQVQQLERNLASERQVIDEIKRQLLAKERSREYRSLQEACVLLHKGFKGGYLLFIWLILSASFAGFLFQHLLIGILRGLFG